MMPTLESAVLPLLRRLDAETAHTLALRALRCGLVRGDTRPDDPVLGSTVFRRHFPNPIGLAAGFDKDAIAVAPLMRLGFGFIETGTVTPRPQTGNPRPRMFRLEQERAAINRLGFNNAGIEAYCRRLAMLGQHGICQPGVPPLGGPRQGVPQQGIPQHDIPQHDIPQRGIPQHDIAQHDIPQYDIPQYDIPQHGIPQQRVPCHVAPRYRVPLGANLGINKEGADPIRDYPALIAAVAPYVDYAVINVSSPNTPGLRDLQGEAQLRAILAAIAAVPDKPPILVKIAPDLSQDGLASVVQTCIDSGVQGLIVSNTTITRPPGLRSPLAGQAGGLSGAPLFALSTRMLARAFLLAGGRLALIGAGGVASGEDALTKIRAGASLVQLYTAFAFAGPALIPRIKHELAAGLRRAGFARIQDAIGSDAAQLAGSA